jgi:hypothetical protein
MTHTGYCFSESCDRRAADLTEVVTVRLEGIVTTLCLACLLDARPQGVEVLTEANT